MSARSLAAAGWEVEIAAVAGPDVPDEERDGDVRIRRYRPSGPLRRWATQPAAPKPPTQVLRRLVRRVDKALKAWLWPIHVRAWWRTLRRELPPADLYHAFGILTVPVALDLAAEARRQGRQGIVIYDVIDAILDSNNYQHVPGPLLDRFRAKEAGWVRRVDAVVTVNEALAGHCADDLAVPGTPHRAVERAGALGSAGDAARSDPARRPTCPPTGPSSCSSGASVASGGSRRPPRPS